MHSNTTTYPTHSHKIESEENIVYAIVPLSHKWYRDVISHKNPIQGNNIAKKGVKKYKIVQ